MPNELTIERRLDEVSVRVFGAGGAQIASINLEELGQEELVGELQKIIQAVGGTSVLTDEEPEPLEDEEEG